MQRELTKNGVMVLENTSEMFKKMNSFSTELIPKYFKNGDKLNETPFFMFFDYHLILFLKNLYPRFFESKDKEEFNFQFEKFLEDLMFEGRRKRPKNFQLIEIDKELYEFIDKIFIENDENNIEFFSYIFLMGLFYLVKQMGEISNFNYEEYYKFLTIFIFRLYENDDINIENFEEFIKQAGFKKI